MDAALLETISRTCEAGIWRGSAMPIQRQQLMSTGMQQLDAAIGGGIPPGRIVEIYGAEGGGKTTLALHLATATGGPIVYVDADHALSPVILGGREVYLLELETMEDTLQACLTAVIGGVGAVVIDTAAALPTRAQLECSILDRPPDNQAKVLSHWLPQLLRPLQATGSVMILVNQMRDNPAVMYGRPDRPTGGRAIRYYAALRLETRRVEILKSNDDVVGQRIAVDVTKCKYAAPGKRAYLTLTYGLGLE